MWYMRHLAILAMLGGAIACASAASWTQYRGSNHDATATEPIRTNWTAEPPRVLWRKPLPFGLSSFSVGENRRLYTMARRTSGGEQREFCVALNADTGDELWATEVGLADYPHGGVGSDDGPRSTPTIVGDRVITFGSYMNLMCLDAASGDEIWSHELIEEYGSRLISWQNAASPTVAGDLVFVNSNGRDNEHLIAFRVSDGSVAWKRGSYGMTHATPVRATIGGAEQVNFFGQQALVAVEPTTGNVLWNYPLVYNHTSVAASPVVEGNTVYISRAYPLGLVPAAGALVVQVNGENGNFTASEKWQKINQLMNHWSTPVFHDGHYYGNFGQSLLELRCVDASDGETRWAIRDFGYGSVTLVQDKLLVLADDGELVLVETNPEEYSEIARFRPEMTNPKCWNNPAVSDGRIYIRSTREALAIDLSVASAAPLPPLKLGVADFGGGAFTLEIAPENGSALDAQLAPRISVTSNSDLDSAIGWMRVSGSTVLTNGKLTLQITPTEARKFFRTEENP